VSKLYFIIKLKLKLDILNSCEMLTLLAIIHFNKHLTLAFLMGIIRNIPYLSVFTFSFKRSYHQILKYCYNITLNR